MSSRSPPVRSARSARPSGNDPARTASAIGVGRKVSVIRCAAIQASRSGGDATVSADGIHTLAPAVRAYPTLPVIILTGDISTDTLREIGTCVTRKTLAGDVINPEEAITVEEGLRAQTVNAAYVSFEEHRLGTLEPGKLADLVVLGEDPFQVPPDRFEELPVDHTIVGGKLAHSR